MRRESVLALAAIAATASFALAAPEVEPNDTKATANAQVLTAGATITGNSQGTSTVTAGATSADYFLVSTPAQAIAIYRNRLSLGGTQANVGTIRGLGQTATGANTSGPGIPSATALDNAQQTSTGSTTTPARFNQWYTFGPAGQLYYRVTGAAATTADYTATYEQTTVTPTNLGTFLPGSYTFTNTQLSSTVDSEVFLYNADTGLPVPGATNDDFLDGTVTQTGGSTLNSLMTRTLTPGNYFLAISDFNTADSQLSPADEGTANGTFMDFPGVMVNSSTTLRPTFPFRMIHPGGQVDFSAAKAGAFDINFFSFTVMVPEPTTLGLLGLGLPALLRRRRA